MKITLDVYRVEYAPWETDESGDVIADERERIGESHEVITFDNATECADWLDRHGLNSPSSDPGPYDRRTWLHELDPYEHPYTGVLEEVTAHVHDTCPPRLWAAIVARVSRPWTRYSGPYFVA